MVDARETSKGRVAETLGSGNVAVGAAARHEEERDVEGRDVQDGGCEVEYGAIVRGENG